MDVRMNGKLLDLVDCSKYLDSTDRVDWKVETKEVQDEKKAVTPDMGHWGMNVNRRLCEAIIW